MRVRQRTWAVVLAAGDGTRLATLTTDASGNPVPKQFCSLNGGRSLLHEALQRARRIVPRDRVCAIVADQHRSYWRSSLWALASSSVIVQPCNRGTAHGVLLTVLAILERDPLARIVFLPADHYVRDERGLTGSLRDAATLLSRNPEGLVLVGIELPSVDLSGAVMQGAESSLRVIVAPACGWNDLGTPKRVADTLRRLEQERLKRIAHEPAPAAVRSLPAFINLAAQHARLGLVN